ncbi:MAG TPA: DUF4157 domain-containing protein [Actinomycetota bacterium]|nr:DUF4157 domain-containing protein [Actinomycetota bacterium]
MHHVLELRRQTAGPAPAARAVVDDALRAPARPLEPVARRPLEARFGHDFGRVRVHADDAAARATDALGARAFTAGEHVVLARDERDAGRSATPLLAHELTHVVQQRMGAAGAAPARPVDAERDASHAAAGGTAPVTVAAAPGSLQRAPKEPGLGSTLPYREAIEEIERHERFTPPGARVTDTRPPILPADRDTMRRMLDFMERASQAIRELIAAAKPSEPWLVEKNANIQAVLGLMAEFRMDVHGGNIVVRFDQPGGGNVAAHYDHGENLIHVPPIANDDDVAIVMPSLLHEYAHAKQDRARARLVAAAGRPLEHTRADELAQETEGRLYDVYAAQLLSKIGMGPRDANAQLNVVFGTVGFLTDFERIRTGKTKAERAAGAAGVRTRLEGPYKAQIETNAPALEYPIEIEQSNHAVLNALDASGKPQKIDLGTIPAGVKSRGQLSTHLAGQVSTHARFASLFRGAGGKSYVVAHFVVYFRNVDGREEVVTQFSLAPPAPPAAAPGP